MEWSLGTRRVLPPVLAAILMTAMPSDAAAASVPLADEVHALATLDTSGNAQQALRRIDATLARASRNRAIRKTDILLAEATRGEALFWLGRYPEALAVFQHFDRSMTALHQPMTPRWTEVINNIGSAYSSMGVLDEAARYKQRALDLSAEIAGTASTEYAYALYGLALVDYRRGHLREAVPRIEQAIVVGSEAAARTGKSLELPVVAGITLASIEMQGGDTETAVSAARTAARWADERLGPEHRMTLAALNQLGAALNDAGLYGQATPILRRVLDLRMRTLPAGHPDIAFSLNALGFALEHAGYSEEALSFYERSAAMLQALPVSQQGMSGANVFGQLGRSALRNGEEDKALALYGKALDLARRNASSPDDLEVLLAERNYAAELVNKGDLDEAERLLDHAVAGYAKQADPAHPDRVAASAWRGAVTGKRGDPAAGLREVEAALAPLRTRLLDRATTRSETMRMRVAASDLFVLEAHVAIAAGDMERAFDALQMAGMGDLQSAFASLDAIRDDFGPEAGAAIGDYLAASARLAVLRKQRDRAVGLGEREKLSALDAGIAEGEARLRELDARVVRLVPGYGVLTGFSPASLDDVRARLGRNEAMLLYGQDDEGVLILAVTRKAVTPAYVHVAPRRLLDLQRRMRASIDGGLLADGEAPFDRDAAYHLYEQLIPAPIARAIEGHRDVRILAPGMLAALPFDALVTAPPEGDDNDPEALRRTAWFVRNHAVSTMISAQPARRQARRQAGPENGFAGIGALRPKSWADQPVDATDPARKALANLPDLPGAARELEAMSARLGGKSLLLLGDAATEGAVKAAPLGHFSVIAFATHGLVGGALRDLVEPALVLAPPGTQDRGDDGLLSASEIAQMRLDADWVILSACDTSAGENENAPTYSGLARAFITAGARALLLSHWPVRDEVAGRMTLYTVKVAGGHGARRAAGRAEALRRAQLRIMNDPDLVGAAHPATWAPFVLVGD